MSGFGDLAFSMAMRDTIKRMVREEVDEQRPKYRYGQVVAIDHGVSKCDVIYTGESNPVRVNMGTIRPMRKGQYVRIEGIGTDKFITDVVGQWGSGQLAGTVAPYHSSGPVSVIWDGDTTPSGPYKYVMRGYSPRGGDRVTMIPTSDGIMVAPSSVDLSLPATRQHRSVPQFYNVRDTIGFASGFQDYQTPGWASFLYNSDRDPIDWFADYLPVSFGRTAAGVVKLRGLARKTSAVVAGETIFTLPEGYRPASQQSFASSNSSAGGAGSLDVLPDGRVTIRSSDAAFLSFDNITFMAADAAPNEAWTEIGTAAIPFKNGWSHYNAIGPAWTKVSYFVDKNGWVHWRGLLHRASGNPSGAVEICTVPLAISAPRSTNTRTMSGNVTGNVSWSGATGQIMNGKTPSQGNYLSLDGMCYPGNSAEALGRYIYPSLLNGFTNWEATNAKGYFSWPSVVKTLDGLAQIMGTVRNAGPNNQVIYNVPVGYRPKSRVLWASVFSDQHGRIDMAPNGDVYPVGTSVAPGGYIAFDMLTYVPEI